MLVGHVGAAMALNRLDRRINLGVMVLAATLMDAVLWVLISLGRERIIVPADFAERHYLTFYFPYSHSLVSAVIISLVVGTVAWFFLSRSGKAGRWAGLIVGGAYFSHWILDSLVHVPGLPIASEGSAKFGLSLWQHISVALTLESMIALAGLFVYLSGSQLTRGRKAGMVAFVGVLILFTVVGQLGQAPPANMLPVAIVSFSLIVVMTTVAWLLSRPKKQPSIAQN